MTMFQFLIRTRTRNAVHLFESLISRATPKISRRSLAFTFAGPRKLDDLLKKETVEDKTSTEVTDIWYSYHEGKENVIGLVLSGECGKKVISRASECPFFVQPVFRDDGYFMLVSQFQKPSHFLCAYLEDYKMDPNAATPLITFSLFDDFANEKDITLVRCDVLNKGIEDEEGRKVVESLIDNYKQEEIFSQVKAFNKKPAHFDFDDYINQMNEKWKTPPANTDA